jgi:hypothetical protein
MVRENKKFGFIDRTGRAVLEPKWDIARFYWEPQSDMSGPVDNDPYYWLVARDEEPGQARGKSKARVLWLDSTGKQIWSSDNSNSSTGKDALKSPAPPVSPAQDKQAAPLPQ